MSLIQRVTALAQAVAADIKALYTGKAEKEHTHTAAQVSGLGTAATKPSSLTGSLKAGVAGRVVWSPTSSGIPNPAVQYNYPGTGAGGGGFTRSLMQFELPSGVGVRLGARGGGTGLSYGVMSAAPSAGWWSDPFSIRVYNGSEPRVGAHRIRHAGNTLLLGATKTAALTTLNLTQQEKAIKDPSGIWVESGALTNDMSSYLSSKTYAEMRTKLGVVPVTVVQDTGTSTTAVMSQKAVTDNLDSLGDELGTLRQELDNLKNMLPHDIFPAAIGDERWGGFYIGDITIPSGDDAGTYMVIMAGEEGESQEKWKLTGTNTTGTTDRNNGKSNTLGMVNAGISEHPAGEYCVNYRGGGFDDWYMPAINEVALAWDNRALLDDLKMGTRNYWSSTQSAYTQARDFDFYREKEDTYSKTSSIWVRPVRRIKKS